MTPLAARLARRIAATGPITVGEFMAMALGDPDHGYYRRGGSIGAAGDFITAPEISQMFGELIGAWLIDRWNGMGKPSPVRLVELGPGRGVLMADALRVANLSPAWLAALDLHLVEIDPDLTRQQRLRLERFAPTWHASLTTVPAGPLLVVANEFLDALPIHQLVAWHGRWYERLVGWRHDTGFIFETANEPSSLALLVPTDVALSDGALFELCPPAIGIVSELARRIVISGGAALLIDYGHTRSAAGDTLQAVKNHHIHPTLQSVGEADLSAHVDFGMLARVATDAGATIHGPISQREFLTSLGISLRADMLKRQAAVPHRASIDAAITRLIDENEMGTLFKVLILSASG